MLNRILASNAYGSGLIHSSDWMTKISHNIADGTTYFMERMWIPLTLLNTKKIREILAVGGSFLAKREFRTTLINKKISNIFSKRFRVPGLINYPHFLDSKLFDLAEPSVKEYDTGAHIHEIAKFKGYNFESIPTLFWSDVYHFDGVTRAKHRNYFRGLLLKAGVLSERVENNLTTSEQTALIRLKEKYPEFLL